MTNQPTGGSRTQTLTAPPPCPRSRNCENVEEIRTTFSRNCGAKGAGMLFCLSMRCGVPFCFMRVHSKCSEFYGGSTYECKTCKSPRREVVRSSAGACVVYPPLFGGRSLSIPRGMILDIQPLVKSLFCPRKRSPNGFFDSEASETGYHFWGGGSKVCAQKELNGGQVQVQQS